MFLHSGTHKKLSPCQHPMIESNNLNKGTSEEKTNSKHKSQVLDFCLTGGIIEMYLQIQHQISLTKSLINPQTSPFHPPQRKETTFWDPSSFMLQDSDQHMLQSIMLVQFLYFALQQSISGFLFSSSSNETTLLNKRIQEIES